MELGFETIGNATLICHDRGPLLATDPWIEGPAYFGSWNTSHEIPEEQLANVRACKYLWISHGHPDHLSHASLAGLKDKKILLPDHYGGRIARDLRADGYDVTILVDGAWTELSDRVRVVSIGDIQQDAILLVDMDGRLLCDTNDATKLGVESFLMRAVAGYDESFLLCLTGYGDADMLNFFDEEGRRIPPPAMQRVPFIAGIETHLKTFGIRAYVPFSSQHRYQRTDSAWANECTTPVEAYAGSFSSPDHELLPCFCRYDLLTREATPIDPPPRADMHEPEEFGDNWSDELEPEDVEKIADYFRPITHLSTFLGFVEFEVGGKTHRIDLAPEHDRGITFAAPRTSLMTCIEWRIFDDLLIGNFARTTLRGDWKKSGTAALYPDFTPFVGKFADNGDARTPEELRAYFAEYTRRGFFALPDDEAGRELQASLAPYLP
jgi:hypothetical protein